MFEIQHFLFIDMAKGCLTFTFDLMERRLSFISNWTVPENVIVWQKPKSLASIQADSTFKWVTLPSLCSWAFCHSLFCRPLTLNGGNRVEISQLSLPRATGVHLFQPARQVLQAALISSLRRLRPLVAGSTDRCHVLGERVDAASVRVPSVALSTLWLTGEGPARGWHSLHHWLFLSSASSFHLLLSSLIYVCLCV